MDTKQALERCFNYFLDPKHEAGYRGGDCVYYANGSKPVMCAIGCLLPKKYRVNAGKVHGGLGNLFDRVPGVRKFFEDTDRNTLAEMQSIHDMWASAADEYVEEDCITREQFLDYLQSLMCYHESVEWL